MLYRLTTDVLSHKVPQFKLDSASVKGREGNFLNVRQEGKILLVRSVLSQFNLDFVSLLSCLLRIRDVKIIIHQNCGERKYDTGTGFYPAGEH